MDVPSIVKTLLERPKDSLDQLTTRSTSPSPDNISVSIDESL